MPRTKLHRTVEKHRKQQAQSKGDRAGKQTIALDVDRIEWSRIDNPFILPEGAQIYE